MKYSSRFFLYAPFAALCALFAVTSLWWWSSASAWSGKLDALNGHEVMPGIRLHFAAKSISGFPFRIDTAFKDFTLTGAGPRAFTWTSEDFAMHRLTYGNPNFVFEAGGRQQFRWRRENGSSGTFAFLPGSIRASAVMREGGLARFDCVLVALDSPLLTIGNAELHLRASPVANALDLVMRADSIRQSANPRAAVLLPVNVAPRTPLQPLLHAEQDWRAVLEAWRKRGGTVRAKGQNDTITLDASHRFIGHLLGQSIRSIPLY